MCLSPKARVPKLPVLMVLLFPACGQDPSAGGSERDAAATDTARADLQSADSLSTEAHAAEDVTAADVNQPCGERREATCVIGDGCYAIRGLALASYCQGTSAPTFAGCVPGGPDGGAAITWGQQEGTGQVFRFLTTQMPAGWTRTTEPTCAADGGDAPPVAIDADEPSLDAG
jgi:hypothetical protein